MNIILEYEVFHLGLQALILHTWRGKAIFPWHRAPLWGNFVNFYWDFWKGTKAKDQGQRRPLPPLNIRPGFISCKSSVNKLQSSKRAMYCPVCHRACAFIWLFWFQPSWWLYSAPVLCLWTCQEQTNHSLNWINPRSFWFIGLPLISILIRKC